MSPRNRTLDHALRVAILAPLLPLLAACGLDTGGKVGCASAADCSAGRACQNMVCVDGDPAQSDSDGDGLKDSDELAGWEIDVDERGYGLVAGPEFITRRHVASDPTQADTDRDGLTDPQELTERSDPTKPDTDGDGLGDLEEKVRWRSNLLSVDTDGDARNPDANTLPLAALFDGAELLAGTSPTLEDTDGDGLSDREERDVSNRSPLVAEIPQAEISVAGQLTVQMNVEYRDETSESETYGSEYSTTEASRTSRSDMESTAVTIAASSGGDGFFDDLDFSKEGAIKFFGGKALEMGRSAACQSAATGRIQFDADHPLEILNPINTLGMLAGLLFEPTGLTDTGICDPPTPETVNTTSTTLTQESSRQATESYSRYRTDAHTRTEVAADGTVSLGFRLHNVGISTFELVNPTLTMMQWATSPEPGAAIGAGAFRTLATLRAIDGGVLDPSGNRTFTLAPNEEALVQMENRQVNADFIKSFLERPQAIFFSPAQFNLSDRGGADFDYLTEQTYNRTAVLVIDSGSPAEPVQRYQFATNVNRDADGRFAGVRMQQVMQDILHKPYSTRAVARRDGAGATVMVEELDAVGNLRNQRSPNRGDPVNGVAGDPQGFWVIYVKRQAQALPELPFEDITFLAGDEVRLVYVRDVDGDGLMAREEVAYGSSDAANDSDGDGLSDFQELKVGWEVTVRFELDGTPRMVSYRVNSDPTRDDPDGDGLSDAEERQAGTDPNNLDTDDDGRSDRCDEEPLNPDLAATNTRCVPVPRYAYVAQDFSLFSLAIGPGETLAELAGGPLRPPTGNVRQMVVTPDGAHLYACGGRNGDEPIHAYDVDLGSGALTRNPYPQLVLGGGGLRNWRSLVMHPSGRFVYGADEGPDADQIAVYFIDQGTQPGRLTPVDDYRDLSNPRSLLMPGAGNFLYALGSGREIAIYRVDRDAAEEPLGTLALVGGAPLSLSYYPASMTASPGGDLLIIAESSGTLHPYLVDPAAGTLTTVPGNYAGANFPQSMKIDLDGNYLYVAASGALYLHRINPATGSLSPIDADQDPNTGFTGVPVTGGVTDFAFGGDGRQLFVTGTSATQALRIGADGLPGSPGAALPIQGTDIVVLSRVP